MAGRNSEIAPSFWRFHLFAPLTVFIVLASELEISRIDLVVADWLFRLEGGQWVMQHSFLFSDVLHSGAAALMKVLALLVMVLAAVSLLSERMKPYRRALWYLALSMPLSALLVSIGKNITHVDCPWDLLRYGGDKPYLGLFESHPGNYGYGKCFPSGHASSGYALLAFYFFFLRHGSRWRWWGLFVGLSCGLLFGVTQQIRGAHFLSHDLWALAVCWFNSLAWYLVLFTNRRRSRAASASLRTDREDPLGILE